MKYIEEENTIRISVRELVATARRRISSVPSHDEDEPHMREASERLRKRLLGNESREELIYSERVGDHLFEIRAFADKIDDMGTDLYTNIYIIAEDDMNPAKPSPTLKAQMRGEGYATAYIYSALTGKKKLKLTIVYIDAQSGEYAEDTESLSERKLETFFKKCTASLSVYAAPEIYRVTERLPSMRSARFPHPKIRDGQSEFIHAAYKNIARGGVLYATAPTGTGKTVSAIYPAMRAMGDGRRDKTFYLTPKETTAIAAVECLNAFAEQGVKLRATVLAAKEKRCKRGSLCKESRTLCPAAECAKIAEATLALYGMGTPVIGAAEIDAVAAEYTVCPYELSLSYAELCDFVICDFNYLFDPTVYIRRFFTEGGNYTFLIDEAHNLPDRAREMYSAEISAAELNADADDSPLGELSEVRRTSRRAMDDLVALLYPYVKEEIRRDSDGKELGAVHISEIPSELYPIFDEQIRLAEDELLINFRAQDEEKNKRIRFLRDRLYKLKRFRNVMEVFDTSYEMFIFYESGDIRAKLYCIDTGKEINKRLGKGSAAIFFSATLTPLYYYKAVLGGDGTADTLEVPSPFDSDSLSVSIMDKISTRYSEREDTLSAVVRAIAAAISARRGNYMIFSPSFAYSEALARAFKTKYPKLKVLEQRRRMSAKERGEFLDEFKSEDKSYLIAFCVMGGVYAEGIDLAGDSLIGAVVVGIGLPGLSYEREAISAYYDERYEEGKQFSYIYPGMNRVLQAAGRVIRREDDRGIIVLIDDRFADPIYKKIVPKLWSGMQFISDPKELKQEIEEFWKRGEN